LLLTVIRFIT